MNKKEALFELLNDLQNDWPVAKGLKELIAASSAVYDLDKIWDVIKSEKDKIKNVKLKDKIERQINYVDAMRKKEEDERSMEDKDADELLENI